MISTTVVETICDICGRSLINALGKAQKHDLSQVLAHAESKFYTHLSEAHVLLLEHSTQTSTPAMSFDSTGSSAGESLLE